MEDIKVLNKATDVIPENSVYIGRPSKWGNLFVIGKDGTRAEVIRKYEEYLRSNPELMDSLKELKEKNLVCWCSPLPCHGNVIMQLMAEQERENLIER